MNIRYRIELSQAERDDLTTMLSKGKCAARKLKRAQILLAADAGRSDEEIARTVAVGGSTVYRTKRRFVEGNLERALSEEQRPGAERKLTGKEEALLVATACTKPPAGRARWTLELLAGAMVKLTDHESLSGETVRRRLAENGLKPWRRDRRPARPVPGPQDRRPQLPRHRNRRMGTTAQRPHAHASSGCSQPKKPAPKWAAHIPTRPKNHNHCDEVLVLLAEQVIGTTRSPLISTGPVN
jgi:transposase